MKIPVFCSLLPTELIMAMGHEVHFLEADDLLNTCKREGRCAFHENLCSYTKALYSFFEKRHGDYDLIVVPTACDALKKLSNALSEILPPEKLHILIVPQNKGDYAGEYFSSQLEKLAKRFSLYRCENEKNRKTHYDGGILQVEGAENKIKIGIIGANAPLGVLKDLSKKFGLDLVYLNHCLVKSYADEKMIEIAQNGVVEEYARLFFVKNSCPRTNDHAYKEALIKKIKNECIAGLIVNTMKFCDFTHFDYNYLRKKLNIPSIILEHELEGGYEGQIMTRLEAFFEGIIGKVKVKNKAKFENKKGHFVGIDSGSHATKLVCIDEAGREISRQIAPTGTSVKNSVEKVLKMLNAAGVERKDVCRIVATGYGRNNVECADQMVTEISCHAAGAFKRLSHAATIIDIGGQDSKVIRIDDEGKVIQFAMNDKCAAGTGRFLEVMANKLEMSLEEFAILSMNAKKTVPISNMCSVFAESEVISLIASGGAKEEIAKGIHRAIADRTASLARRVGGVPPYYMAGGVSKNSSLVAELGVSLKSEVNVMEEPQFTGALGAALFALRGE